MTGRERYINAIKFRECDFVPFHPGSGRKSTRERWYGEGLPPDTADITAEAYRQAGGVRELPKGGPGFPVNHFMIPRFEEKVIEVRENSQVVQDWKGNICEIGLEFDVSYLRSGVDFVTRNWLKCPVESRADWDEMKKRYNPYDPSRLPSNARELGEQLKERRHMVSIMIHGPYWQLREWCGFEELSLMFYDDSELVKDMISFWEDYVSKFLGEVFKYVIPDEIHVSEDMAYKGHSMVSPDMVHEFLLPTWKKWGKLIHEAGVPLYTMDSDGHVGELIPSWIEAGFDACDPLEVAAGNDIVELRRKFGHQIAFRQGVDKREIAKGGKHIEAEIERLMPVIRDGGFIPGCDHGVPSDVSWRDFVYYCKLLGKATGWID